MKKSNIEKYYNQKNWSIPEIVCVVVLIVAIIFILAISIPIGVPMGGVAVIVLVFMKSAKIKDEEVDLALDSLIAAHGITIGPESTICVYDLTASRVIKGKDGKLRSNRYVVSVMTWGCDTREIEVYRIEILTGQVIKKKYALTESDDISLQEKPIVTPIGRKTAYFLACSAFDAPIPVSMDDIQASKIVEKMIA